MKKILLSTAGLLLYVSVSLFALTDAFTGANGTALTTGSWNIAEGASSWEIQSNKASPVSVGRSAMNRSEAAFPADQFAQGVMRNGTSADIYVYLAVRMTTDTYYFVRMLAVADGAEAQILKRSAGGAPQFLNSAAHGASDGVDTTVKLAVSTSGANAVLEVFVSGVSKVTYTDTSSPITSGRPGFGGLWDGLGTKQVVDDFASTDASAGTTSHIGPFFGMGHF